MKIFNKLNEWFDDNLSASCVILGIISLIMLVAMKIWPMLTK